MHPSAHPPDAEASIAALPGIIESFPDGIAIHASGRIAYLNPALTRMLGYDGGTGVESLEWPALVHGDDLAGAIAYVERALAAREGTALPPSQHRLLTNGGEPLPAEVRAVRLSWNGAAALLLVIRDRTERERLEAGLREAARMAAAGALAAGVAHEINNPLAYVVTNVAFVKELFAELTPTNLEDNRSAVRDALDETRQGIERIAHVVSDLKTFTRGEERVDLVDLGHVVASTIRVALPAIRHRATVVTDLRAAPLVKGRASRLGQVFLNLLLNAAQAMTDESRETTVTVRVRAMPDRGACVEVEDTGDGIPAEVLPRVFEPFFTTKPIGVGTGLGLAVCKNIIEEHGGSITIDSEPGRGTRVRVVLPAAPVDFRPHVSSGTMRAVRRRRYHVLVIDDDQLVLNAMKRLLRKHSVVIASDGSTALELLSREPDFDVILCDLMMPGVTGMDVYESLSRSGSGLERRIVFVSGGAVTKRALDLLERVPNLRLEKPLDPRRIDEMLALAVEAAEAPLPAG